VSKGSAAVEHTAGRMRAPSATALLMMGLLLFFTPTEVRGARLSGAIRELFHCPFHFQTENKT
jgi:hypothetical protein